MMRRIPLLGLVGTGLCAAVVSFLFVSRLYGHMTSVPVSVPMILSVLAGVNAVAAMRVSKRIEGDEVGQDRSQINPVTIANLLVVGRATAWTGSVFTGGYVGMACYVVPKRGDLAAAQADTPLVLVCCIAAACACACGVWLERACCVPPPPNGESVR